MLVLHKGQVNTLDAEMVGKFIEELTIDVQQNFGEELQEFSEGEIRQQINDFIFAAANYDIKSKQAVALFVNLSFHLEKDFELLEENDWMLSILKDDGLPELEKMTVIYTHLEQYEDIPS